MNLMRLWTWLKNLWSRNTEGGLYRLLILGLILSATDILSTWILLSFWPDLTQESVAGSTVILSGYGLEVGLFMILMFRYAIGYLLYKSTLRLRTRTLGLIALVLGGAICTIKNSYFICALLWYNTG